jgi:hypothetical protein
MGKKKNFLAWTIVSLLLCFTVTFSGSEGDTSAFEVIRALKQIILGRKFQLIGTIKRKGYPIALKC